MFNPWIICIGAVVLIAFFIYAIGEIMNMWDDDSDEWTDEPAYDDNVQYAEAVPDDYEYEDFLPATYGEDTLNVTDMSLRLTNPRLFSDTWYEECRKELSEWAAEQYRIAEEFRREMGLAT